MIVNDIGKQLGVPQAFPKNVPDRHIWISTEVWETGWETQGTEAMRKPIKLTQTIVDTMKVSAGKDEDTIADAAAPGLKLRIRREGAKVFVFQRRFAGQHPKITIGDAATWSLEKARQ